MRILWVSNAPWAHTGYGNQTRLFIPRLQKLGHPTAVMAFYGLEGSMLNWNGIPVYPKALHPWGQDIAAAHAAHWRADVIISLIDAWVMEPEQLQVGHNRWVPWYPVDMEPLPIAVSKNVFRAHDRIVFSRFGERMTADAGLPSHYVPHGIDVNMFYPLPDNGREEARAGFNWDDRFVIGIVAANKGNPSRKSIPEHLTAYKQFKAKHPDAHLYLHTHPSEHGEHQGINIPELCQSLGLSVGPTHEYDVQMPDTYSIIMGLPDDFMNTVYNAMDVFLLASMGEGFGIPIIEAQAAGTPVIVGDWTSMSELCLSGWKIPRSEAAPFYSPLGAYQFLPRVGAIVEALETAYSANNLPARRRKARAQVKRLYDADMIADRYWKPVLDNIAANLGEAPADD